MSTKQAPDEFIKKIKTKINAENLSLRDLAKILGVSPPTVIELVNNGNKPSVNTCIALAKWLRQSDVSILREAGLLPPSDNDQLNFDDWKYLLGQLPADDQEELRKIAEMKIEKQQKDKALKTLHSKKVGY